MVLAISARGERQNPVQERLLFRHCNPRGILYGMCVKMIPSEGSSVLVPEQNTACEDIARRWSTSWTREGWRSKDGLGLEPLVKTKTCERGK